MFVIGSRSSKRDLMLMATGMMVIFIGYGNPEHNGNVND